MSCKIIVYSTKGIGQLRAYMVRVPGRKKLWLDAGSGVVTRACKMCGSPVGVPCHSDGRYGRDTHVGRKTMAYSRILDRHCPVKEDPSPDVVIRQALPGEFKKVKRGRYKRVKPKVKK